MSLGSFIGGALGAVGGFIVGGPAGAVTGAKLGSTLGGAVDGGGKKQSASAPSQQEYFKPTSVSTLADIRKAQTDSLNSKNPNDMGTLVAQVKTPKDVLADPWSPMKDWWKDLGGNPENEKYFNPDDYL